MHQQPFSLCSVLQLDSLSLIIVGLFLERFTAIYCYLVLFHENNSQMKWIDWQAGSIYMYREAYRYVAVGLWQAIDGLRWEDWRCQSGHIIAPARPWPLEVTQRSYKQAPSECHTAVCNTSRLNSNWLHSILYGESAGSAVNRRSTVMMT